MEDFDLAVLEFMNEMGFTAQYVQTANGEYDPATGTVTPVVTQTPVQAILMDLTLSSNGLSTRFGTLVEQGDKQLLVRPPHKATEGATPMDINSASDKVLVHGVEYKVVTFKEINPTGADPLVYDLYIRR